MEELNCSKKDFEKIIQAKNKELEQTKVRGGGQSAVPVAQHSVECVVAVVNADGVPYLWEIIYSYSL